MILTGKAITILVTIFIYNENIRSNSYILRDINAHYIFYNVFLNNFYIIYNGTYEALKCHRNVASSCTFLFAHGFFDGGLQY